MTPPVSELERLRQIVQRLRVECPWDASQTHRSLVRYLVEETGEVVDAIEAGTDADLREELGDLLLQVYFHAEIARTEDRFDLEDVARGISDKLVERHPYVFADQDVPDDLNATWEARKRAAKGRTSALDGIPEQVSALTRATKVLSRTRSHQVPVELPGAPTPAESTAPLETSTDAPTEAEIGTGLLTLAARAQAAGIDPEQALRDAVRALESQVREVEAGA